MKALLIIILIIIVIFAILFFTMPEQFGYWTGFIAKGLFGRG